MKKSSRSGESQSSQNWQLGQTGQVFISTGVFSHCFEGGVLPVRGLECLLGRCPLAVRIEKKGGGNYRCAFAALMNFTEGAAASANARVGVLPLLL